VCGKKKDAYPKEQHISYKIHKLRELDD